MSGPFIWVVLTLLAVFGTGAAIAAILNHKDGDE
jgi:hypothetical protein